jgi:purine-binding chemotaxis protein CheW
MSETVTVPPELTAESEAPVPTRRILVFEAGGAPFACDMEAFREIVPTRPITRLPGAPDTVCGLINLRGNIVTVLDGGVILAGTQSRRDGGLLLILDDAEKQLGLAVDDVRDIQDVPVDQFLDASERETATTQCAIGAVELIGERVLVLDIRTAARQVIGQGR